MKKSEIAELIITYKIPIDELSEKSTVSKETILTILAYTNEAVSHDMLLKLKRSINEFILEHRSSQLHNSLQLIKENQSIEEQLSRSRARSIRLVELSRKLREQGIRESEAMQIKEELHLLIDQGNASDEEVADLLSDISILYRMQGGAGINFEIEGITTLSRRSHA